MVKEALAQLFERDLSKLAVEIKAYTKEADIWKTAEGISNSGGNLCLHIVGNLKHFVGRALGNIPYEREREKEFSDKDIPLPALVKSVEETSAIVAAALKKLADEDLNKIYPIHVFGYEMTTGSFLIHLYGHLGYHLGQINYHRRLLNR
ncbi:MAG: DinB family protein [Bacteroidetes bacterium]|nr:DinB family protein [Bacteroidota bacterium]